MYFVYTYGYECRYNYFPIVIVPRPSRGKMVVPSVWVCVSFVSKILLTQLQDVRVPTAQSVGRLVMAYCTDLSNVCTALFINHNVMIVCSVAHTAQERSCRPRSAFNMESHDVWRKCQMYSFFCRIIWACVVFSALSKSIIYCFEMLFSRGKKKALARLLVDRN